MDMADRKLFELNFNIAALADPSDIVSIQTEMHKALADYKSRHPRAEVALTFDPYTQSYSFRVTELEQIDADVVTGFAP